MARSRLDSSAVCLDLNDSGTGVDDSGEPQHLSTSKTQPNDMLFVDLTLRRGSVLETSKGDLAATTTTTTTTVAVTPSWGTCLPIYAYVNIETKCMYLTSCFIIATPIMPSWPNFTILTCRLSLHPSLPFP